MKKIYWRPRAVSRTALVLIALVSAAGLYLVENLPVEKQRRHHDEKHAAAELAREAMDAVKAHRLDNDEPVDPELDPAGSGLIGEALSAVTTVSGDLTAKQTSINPNFAAVVVDMLKKAGVGEGDAVAVGVSGSFPALNICVYAALDTLRARPIVIESVSASQFGANRPELLWPDMERLFVERRRKPPGEGSLFSFRAVAASIGGIDDTGKGLSPEGKDLIRQSLERNREAIGVLPPLEMIESDSFEKGVASRWKIYRQQAGRRPIKAYINVGGGTVSVGRNVGKHQFKPGLNLQPPPRMTHVDGVMQRFAADNVPVIHLTRIHELADRYGLPIAPLATPEPGEGSVFAEKEYSRPLAAGVLTAILVSLYGFIRSDIGFRILRTTTRRKDHGHPEPMV